MTCNAGGRPPPSTSRRRKAIQLHARLISHCMSPGVYLHHCVRTGRLPVARRLAFASWAAGAAQKKRRAEVAPVAAAAAGV